MCAAALIPDSSSSLYIAIPSLGVRVRCSGLSVFSMHQGVVACVNCDGDPVPFSDWYDANEPLVQDIAQRSVSIVYVMPRRI